MIRIFLVSAFLLIAGLAYYPTLNTPIFLGNDRIRILDNQSFFDQGIKETFSKVFSSGQGEAQMAERPLTVFSFWINYKFSGLNPFGLRVVNLALHVLVSFLLYLFFCIVFDKKTSGFWFSGFIGALVFLLHPVHFVALYTISQRGIILAALFGLLAVISFIHFHKMGGVAWVVAAYIFLILSVCAKPNGIVFVLVIILYAALLSKRPRSSLCKALMPTIIFPVIILIGHIVNTVHPQIWPGTWSKYVADQAVTVFYYLRIFIFPIDLHFMHTPDPYQNLKFITVLLAGLVHALVLIFALLMIRRKVFLSFGVLAFYAAIIPESSFFPLSYAVAEYRTYMPYLFLSFLAVLIAERFKESKVIKILFIILCIVLFALSWQRNMSMKDEAHWLKQGVIHDFCHDKRSYYATIQTLIVSGDEQGAEDVLKVLMEREPTDLVVLKLNTYLMNAFSHSPDIDLLLVSAEEIIQQSAVDAERIPLMDILLTVSAQKLSVDQNDLFKHKMALNDLEFWTRAQNRGFIQNYPATLQRLKARYEKMRIRSIADEYRYQSVLAVMALWKMSPQISYAERVNYILQNNPQWHTFLK